MNNALNLEQFIQKSKQRSEDRLKYAKINLPAYDMEFPLVRIGFDKLSDLLDEQSDSTRNNITVNKEIVYSSMPFLQNQELQGAYTLTEPWDIVYEVFTASEVNDILRSIFKLNGLDIEREEVKN